MIFIGSMYNICVVSIGSISITYKHSIHIWNIYISYIDIYSIYVSYIDIYTQDIYIYISYIGWISNVYLCPRNEHDYVPPIAFCEEMARRRCGGKGEGAREKERGGRGCGRVFR